MKRKLLYAINDFVVQVFVFVTTDWQNWIYERTVAVPGDLFDVAWTPSCGEHFVCTTRCENEILVVPLSGGNVVHVTKMRAPTCLSVSGDGIMYVADWRLGVYYSEDSGRSWSLVLKVTQGWQCLQVREKPVNASGILLGQVLVSNHWFGKYLTK